MKVPYQLSRTLKRYESKNGRQVNIRVRSNLFNDIEIPVYDYVEGKQVSISVKTEHWKKGHVTGGKYHISLRELNFLLSEVEHSVKDAIYTLLNEKISPTRENILKLTYYNKEADIKDSEREKKGELTYREDGGAFESEDDFLDFLERQDDPKYIELKRKAGLLQRKYIMDYWDEFIETYAPNSYNLSKSSLVAYIQTTNDNCLADKFDSEWLKRYFVHIIENGYQKNVKGKMVTHYYEISSIKKYLKHLRAFGKWLFINKIISTEDYKRFDLKNVDSKKASLIKYKSNPFKNTHALMKSEFDHLFFFNFKNSSYDLIRDLFILQTWFGGLRKSDFFELTEDNVSVDSEGNFNIQFEQRKTESKIINPANQHYVIPILQKYNQRLPEFPSPNKYNKRLKEVFKAAGLNRKLLFRYEYINQKKPTEVYHEMHEMVSNRWARNCAVSILVEEGFSDHYIMEFTGHEDEKMLRHYRTVHKKEVKGMLDEVKPIKKE